MWMLSEESANGAILIYRLSALEGAEAYVLPPLVFYTQVHQAVSSLSEPLTHIIVRCLMLEMKERDQLTMGGLSKTSLI